MKTIAIVVALLSGCFMQDVSGVYLRKADAEGQQNAPVEKADAQDGLLFDFLDKEDHKKEEAKEDGKEAKKDDDADALLFPFLVTKDDEMVVGKGDKKVDEKEFKRVDKKSDHKDDRMQDKVYFLESIDKMHDKGDIFKQMVPAAPALKAIESPAAPVIESPAAAASAPKVIEPPAAAASAPKVIEPPAQAIKSLAGQRHFTAAWAEMDRAPRPQSYVWPEAPAPEDIEPLAPFAPQPIESPSLAPEGTIAALAPEDEKKDKTNRTNMIINNSQIADFHTFSYNFDTRQVFFLLPSDPSMAGYYTNSTTVVLLKVDAVDGCVADAVKFLPNTSKPVTQQKIRELAVSNCESKVKGKTGACLEYKQFLATVFNAEVVKNQVDDTRLYTAFSLCVLLEHWKAANEEADKHKGSGPAFFHYTIGFAQVLGLVMLLAMAIVVKFTSCVLPCMAGMLPKIFLGSA